MLLFEILHLIDLHVQVAVTPCIGRQTGLSAEMGKKGSRIRQLLPDLG
jgi:hypothetical protein